MASTQQAAKDGVVVGLGGLTGEVRPRVDVDLMLLNQPDTFNLFLLALTDLQKDNTGKLGYFHVAGIHGLPTAPWDNVVKIFADSFGGYCAHGVLIFPTWHRPYLSMIEQVIYLKMVDKAEEFDQQHRQKYRDAAKAFRLPYFDYFRPRDKNAVFPGITLQGMKTSFQYSFRMPDIFNVEKVMVRVAPDDKLVPQSNPLYTYNFDPKHGIPTSDWDSAEFELSVETFSRHNTVRYSDFEGATKHDVQQLNDVLNMRREGLSQLTLNLINSEPYNSFEAIASDTTLEGGDMTNSPSGSLEGSIHGNYHNFIGGNAHMSHPSVASFDPVFWFHHCQIDRLFAIWQALHPDSWFPDPQNGDEPESQKNLLPFYASKNGQDETFYTSDTSRTTELFGYVYPDLQDLTDPDQIWSQFENRYSWSTRSPSNPGVQDPPREMAPLNLNHAQVFQYTSAEAATDRLAAHFHSFSKTVASGAQAAVKAVVEGGVSGHQQKPLANPGHEGAVQAANPGHEEKTEAAAQASSSQQKAPLTIDAKFDREWYVDCVVQRNALNGPFTIYFFLATREEFVDDPKKYAVSPYLAGVDHIFVAPKQICDNCGKQDAAGKLASDTVPITPLLLDYLDQPGSGLESLRPEHVRPFLEKHLRWRVVKLGDGKKDPRGVAGLKISVSAKISHADRRSTYEAYPDIIRDIIHNSS